MRRLIRLAFALWAATISGAIAEAAGKPRAQVSAAMQAATAKADAQRRRTAMADVKTWAIQLRFLDRAALAASPFDLVVIDHAPHPKKDIEIPFTHDEIAPLKHKPDGSRRIVLAYLSMGEAERYRYYWQPQWDIAETRPKWLGAENPRWPGDYLVQFADPDWQSVIFGTPASFLDRIIAAGFDGVYLDRVDAFQDVEETIAEAEDAMTGFVQRLADHAHRLNPNFLIIMQNAEELAKSKSLLSRLDGIAKEDLLYGFDNGENANPQQMVVDTVLNLRKAKRAGVKVLVLEYARTADAITATQKLAEREGFVLHITDRMLGVLSPVAPAPTAGE
ncbi:MAG: MJ1477/TM1410 family putative glycoside hydrolase [Hyphomicrobium sp.]